MNKAEKKELIHFDHDQYNFFLNKENELIELSNQLNDHAVYILGSYRVNWVKYLDDPIEYLVNTYWDEYCTNKPDHLNKRTFVIRETNMNTRVIERLVIEFKRVLASLGAHKPKINKAGLKSVLKKDNFMVFLNPEMKKEYEATKKILDGVKELGKLRHNVYEGRIMQVCPEVFRIEEFKPVLHWHHFAAD
jgi:hypothetical protein